MIKHNIDFTKPWLCCDYERMSNEEQNPRSPEQQAAEIRSTIHRLGYPWRIVRTFCDRAIKGAYIRRRPDFFNMLTLIRSGELKVDAILVDTLERFGRAEEIPGIRQELWSQHAVLVLTADSGFADPTTMAGKALGFVEQIRATAGNEVKAHDVWRGKLDAAREKRWPGGPAPFGKRLVRRVVTDQKGRQLTESDLLGDPATEWIVRKLLRLALDTRAGSPKLAQAMNDNAEIPDKFKPFRADTIAYWLDNPIYAGVLRWANKCTGILNDTRVQQKNPDGAEMIHDFCEPLITFDEWQTIQKLRRDRGDRIKAFRAEANDEQAEAGKQIVALGAGLTLNYLLSGLVFCGECNSRMVVCPTRGDSRDGTLYVYYRCPLYTASGERGCCNRKYVREDQLRAAVVGRIRQLLFPPPSADGGTKAVTVPDWLVEVDQLVRRDVARLCAEAPDRRAALRQEVADLQEQMKGWDESLSRRDLQPRLRERYDAKLLEALERVDRVEREIAHLDGRAKRLDRVLDVKAVLAQLRRLDQVLAEGNLTDGNAELSLHVQGVCCWANGRVELRTCKLGAFAGAIELLARGRNGPEGPAAGGAVPVIIPVPDGSGGAAAIVASTANGDAQPDDTRYRVKSRRRGRLQTSDGGGGSGGGQSGGGYDGVVRVACHDRFAGLEDQWFWVEPIEIGRPASWAESNARGVWDAHLKHPALSATKLAKQFPDVSRPTVVAALALGRKKWGPNETAGNTGACELPPTTAPAPSDAPRE